MVEKTETTLSTVTEMLGTVVIPAMVLSRACYRSIVYLCFVSRSPDWDGQAPGHHALCESFLKKVWTR